MKTAYAEQLENITPCRLPINLLTLAAPVLPLFEDFSVEVPLSGPEDRQAVAYIRDRLMLNIAGGSDPLPYSPRFVALYEDFAGRYGRFLAQRVSKGFAPTNQAALYRVILNLRKAGKITLPAGNRRANSEEVIVDPRELHVIKNQIGLPPDRGNRERLPYTHAFDELHANYSRVAPRYDLPGISRLRLWRGIARIMKSERKDDDQMWFDYDA